MSHLSIPFKGLQDGKHTLVFEIDDDFFTHFENEVVGNGQFTVQLELDKKPRVTETTWRVEGKTRVSCDRCLENIELPIVGSYSLLIQYDEEERCEEEVLYIAPDTSVISVSDLIYEYIVLSIPTIKVYDCESDSPIPCNEEVLEKLENRPEKEADSPVWDSLKGIKFDNK